MPAQLLTIPSGGSASSATVLDPSAGTVALFVSSHASVSVHLDFSTTSGGGEWHRLTTALIESGTLLPAVGVTQVLAPFTRVRFGSNAAATTSAFLTPVKG